MSLPKGFTPPALQSGLQALAAPRGGASSGPEHSYTLAPCHLSRVVLGMQALPATPRRPGVKALRSGTAVAFIPRPRRTCGMNEGGRDGPHLLQSPTPFLSCQVWRTVLRPGASPRQRGKGECASDSGGLGRVGGSGEGLGGLSPGSKISYYVKVFHRDLCGTGVRDTGGTVGPAPWGARQVLLARGGRGPAALTAVAPGPSGTVGVTKAFLARGRLPQCVHHPQVGGAVLSQLRCRPLPGPSHAVRAKCPATVGLSHAGTLCVRPVTG